MSTGDSWQKVGGIVEVDSKIDIRDVKLDDPVNKPAHYNFAGIECIDAIRAALGPEGFKDYMMGNVMKYTWRYKYKNGLEDLLKAQWYLDRVIVEVKKDEGS